MSRSWGDGGLIKGVLGGGLGGRGGRAYECCG